MNVQARTKSYMYLSHRIFYKEVREPITGNITTVSMRQFPVLIQKLKITYRDQLFVPTGSRPFDIKFYSLFANPELKRQVTRDLKEYFKKNKYLKGRKRTNKIKDYAEIVTANLVLRNTILKIPEDYEKYKVFREDKYKYITDIIKELEKRGVVY